MSDTDLLDQALERAFAPAKVAREPTGAISTITGEPETRPSEFYRPGPGAGVLTHRAAGVADDPETKLRIYAAARFPTEFEQDEAKTLKRYRIKEGDIQYRGDDGNWYRETPDTFGDQLKKFIGTTAAHAPAILLGMLGEVIGGPIGAGVGAGIGEEVRQAEAVMRFGEEKDPTEMLLSGATEAAFGAGGAAAASGIGKLVDIRRARKGRGMAAAVGAERGLVDISRTDALQEMASRRFGIDLPLPAAAVTQRGGVSRELVDTFNWLADYPASADIAQGMRERITAQVEDAVYRFLDEIHPDPVTATFAGEEAARLSGQAIRRLDRAASDAARPLYRRAYTDAPPVDVKPVVDQINEGLKNAKGKVRDAYLATKKLLMRPDIPGRNFNRFKEMVVESLDDVTEGDLFKELSAAVTKSRDIDDVIAVAERYVGRDTMDAILDRLGVWETSLEGLHHVKISLDEAIDLASRKESSVGRFGRRVYTETKDELLRVMDDASPDYSQARRTYETHAAQRLSRRTLLRDVSRLEGDQFAQASKKMFDSALVSPEAVVKARDLIRRETGGDEVWSALVRTHLRRTFERIPGMGEGDSFNLGYRFWKELFGTKAKREILQAATAHNPQIYRNLRDFMQILKRTGLLFRKESTTAFRQMKGEQLQREFASELLTVVTTPLRTPQRLVADRVNEALMGRGTQNLIRALESRDAARQLAKIKAVSPKAMKFWRQLGVFLSLTAKGQIGDVPKEFEMEGP